MVKKRCGYKSCKKRLNVSDQCLVCKCGKSFCKEHRQCEEHCCPTLMDQIKLVLPKCEPCKLLKV